MGDTGNEGTGGTGGTLPPARVRALSDRELQVLAEMARGRSNREIAEALGIATKTAMHHTESIYLKLGVNGRVQAVATAVRDGLVDPTLP